MQILSVNIAVPQTVEVSGRKVETGIDKRPAQGPQTIRKDGLAGDIRVEPRRFGAENHAIHIYPYEHYAAWEKYLGREPFPFGQFGENLTATGLLESHVRLGDVLRCGTAVLQVTQPRIPCRKLNVRMGLRFAGTFLRSRRVGYYLRVLEEGQVSAGDPVEVLERDTESPTLDDFVRIALIDYWDAEGLEALLKSRHLIDPWRVILKEKLHRARSAEGWLGLRELEVARRVDDCQGVTSFYLRCPYGRPLAAFRAGQYLTIALRPSPIADDARRAYAISSSPWDPSTYRVTVQQKAAPDPSLPEGLVSSRLYRNLGPGDRIRVAAPRGSFTLEEVPKDCTNLLFIAEGIGIASVISMLHHWRRTPGPIPACVVHVVRNRAAQPLRQELLDLANDAGGSLQLRFAYSEPLPGEELQRDYHIRGTITAADLKPLLTGAGDAVFVAGRSSFVGDLKQMILSLGVPEEQLHAEQFGS